VQLGVEGEGRKEGGRSVGHWKKYLTFQGVPFMGIYEGGMRRGEGHAVHHGYGIRP